MATVRTTLIVFLAVGAIVAVARPAGAEVVRQSDLAGWWKMGEGATWNGSSWTVPDASANANTATSVRMAQGDRIAGCPFDPYPESSYAMRLDAASRKHLETAHDASLVMGSSFSITAWVRLSGDNSWDRIIAGRLDATYLRHNYFFQLDEKRVNVGFHDALASGGFPWPKVSGATTLSDNQWYHVAGVFDDAADALTVYLNGRQDGQTGLTGIPSTSSTFGVSIGANAPEGNRWLNGSVDDVRIYNTAIRPAEIAAIYNNAKGDFEPIPEPPSFVLLGMVTAGVLAYAWRKRRR
jgi:hypothetical protein